MAKSQTNKASDQSTQDRQRVIDQGNQIWQNQQSRLPGAQATADQQQAEAQKQYTSFGSGTGAYDTGAYFRDTSQNQQNIGTGGYNPDTLKTLQSDIGSEVTSGGYTPEDIAKLEGSGGLDPTQTAKVRDTYGNLISTGGISDETKAAMERQVSSGVQSTYSTLGQNLARQSAATGQVGGGETATMARQMANAQATGITGVEAQVGQLRQQGQIAGAGGLSQFELGAGQATRDAAGQLAAGKRAGVAQEATTASDVAHGTLTATQAQQDLDTNAANQRIAAAGGLVNLYNSSPGYVNSLVQTMLQTQQQTGSLTAQQNQIMEELSKNPGLFQTILGDVVAVAGAGAGVMTGVGGLGGGKKPPMPG